MNTYDFFYNAKVLQFPVIEPAAKDHWMKEKMSQESCQIRLNRSDELTVYIE